MDDTIYDACFNSLTFGVETTIGCFNFSDEAAENARWESDEAGCRKAADLKWINGDALTRNLPYLVC